jgi:hypothetical protein
MLVAGKSAPAAAAWVSILEAGLVSAEQVWVPLAMVTSAQAHPPLPSG